MKLRVRALTLGLFISTALSGAALAADVETPAVYDWTGFYVGGHVGYGSIDLKGVFDKGDGTDFHDTGSGRFDLDDDGFLGGAQIGYNVQIDRLVLGIEGDFSFTDWSDDVQSRGRNREVSFDTDYFATLRARAGYAVDNILLFATAGVAWTDTEFRARTDFGPVNQKGDVKLNDVGFVFGGGGEYALDENWSIKAEALYAIFNDKERTSNLTNGSEVGDFVKLDDVFVARVGVNFHF